MIRQQQLWVYYIDFGQGRKEMASIVACTRTSENVVAITKVFTNPICRSRGCAERLVRQVCQLLVHFFCLLLSTLLTFGHLSWLLEVQKHSVVLFVAHDNLPAATVYSRVGFVGINGTPREGVEDWVEIGFVDTARGHW